MVLTIIYLLYLVAPILLLLVGSFGKVWTNTLLPTGFTTEWYAQVATDPSFRRAFATSLEVVVATATVDALVGVPLAYAIFASRRRGVRVAARILTVLPIAVPELVLAFGFILAFSSDLAPWLGTLWLLIAAHVVVTLPYLLGVLLSDMATLDIAFYERTASSLGASFRSRFLDIVLPTLRHSIVSGLIAVAAISIGEFQISNLVSGFLSRTYPVVLLQAFYGATGFACAATVILLGIAVVAAGSSALVAGALRTVRTR